MLLHFRILRSAEELPGRGLQNLGPKNPRAAIARATKTLCSKTPDSNPETCQEKGHKVTEKEATKTRWECGSCRHSEAVLDRQLPSYCRSCSGCNWKQVSLVGLRVKKRGLRYFGFGLGWVQLDPVFSIRVS